MVHSPRTLAGEMAFNSAEILCVSEALCRRVKTPESGQLDDERLEVCVSETLQVNFAAATGDQGCSGSTSITSFIGSNG